MAKKPTTFFPPATKVVSSKAPSPKAVPVERDDAEIEQAMHVLTPQTLSFQDIPTDRLRPNPFQARSDFDTEESRQEIEELAQSIREHGFVSVLFVRPDREDGYFQLAYGERRWRAAKLLGLDALPCRISTYTDEQMEDIGLIENIQRKALNPVDEALALQRKLERINPKTGKPFSIRSLADHLGVKKHRIEEPLRLCTIPADCTMMVRKRPDTVRVAFEIAKLPTVEAREPLISKVLEREVNTKEVMYLVEQLLSEQQRSTIQQTPSDTTELISSGERSTHDLPGSLMAAPPLPQDTIVVTPLAHTYQKTVETPKGKMEEKAERSTDEAIPQQQVISATVLTDKQASLSVGVAPASSPFVEHREQTTTHSTASLEQRLQEKRIIEDSKRVLLTLRRWSVWVEDGTYEKSLLVDHVRQWMVELEHLNECLQTVGEEERA